MVFPQPEMKNAAARTNEARVKVFSKRKFIFALRLIV
jgi:hypothetical protein